MVEVFLGSKQCNEILDEVGNFQLLKKDSAQWSYLFSLLASYIVSVTC
jgi:hypothetical protein